MTQKFALMLIHGQQVIESEIERGEYVRWDAVAEDAAKAADGVGMTLASIRAVAPLSTAWILANNFDENLARDARKRDRRERHSV